KDVLETAMRLHAIDVAADDLVVLAEADLVILAAPVKENIALLDEMDQHIAQSAIVTDTGSTKREIVSAARRLPPRFTFIGGHPLGGAAHGGLEHARPDLFTGRPWLLTVDAAANDRPQGENGAASKTDEAVGQLSQFVRALGSEPLALTAEAHERLMS